jgi:hypothetical protein
VKFIKAQRIRWLGHVKRMEAGAMPRKMMEGRLFIGRTKGRPRLRWLDDVVADLKVMKIKKWKEKMKESNGDWLLRRPRLTQGCSAESMDGFFSRLLLVVPSLRVLLLKSALVHVLHMPRISHPLFYQSTNIWKMSLSVEILMMLIPTIK